mgnify:CR=1 FL=1
MFTFISIAFIFWRILLFGLAWLGSQLLPFSPRFPYADVLLMNSGLPGWIWSFANFDGVHYLTIAQKGYAAQFTQVFFPVYPLIVSLITLLTPFKNLIVSGLLLSNILFLFALILFWKLLALDYSKDTIQWTIIFLLSFPASFFFGALYTESLFLFLVFLSFYLVRKKNWWLAGIVGGIASGVKFVGIFLLPALLWEWWQQKKILHSPSSIFHSPVLYLVPLGLISYMIYLQLQFRDWLYFWHAQPVFGAERTGGSIVLLPQVIWRYIKILWTVSPLLESYWISLLELSTTILGISLLVIAHKKKVRSSYLIFSWLAVIIPTLTGTLSSMPRYVLVIFPIYIVLALRKNTLGKMGIIGIFCLLLFILTVLFTRGHWVG